MDKNFCQQIDKELLVEQYVCGQLKGDLLEKFENHLRECEVHAQAVILEKAIKRGVSEFARGEIKTKLHDRLKKREDTRFLLLRYAAILFVAVITPLILYYQFNISPGRTVRTPLKIQQQPVSPTISKEEKPVEKNSRQIKTTTGKRKESLPIKQKSVGEPVGERISPNEAGNESGGRDRGEVKTLPLSEASPSQPLFKQNMDTKVADVSAPKVAVDYSNEKEIKTARGFSSAYSTKDVAKGKDGQSTLLLEWDKKLDLKCSEIEQCMQTFLKENERSGYQISLSIHILPSGEVREIKVLDATIHFLELETCILNILKKWTFSTAEKDTTIEKTIRYKQH